MPNIYRTPDGAILKTQDGRLIKQPHEFGNAFQNRMGLNNYVSIKFNPVYINNGFTLVVFMINSAYGSHFTLKGDSLDNNNYISQSGLGAGLVKNHPVSPLNNGMMAVNTLYSALGVAYPLMLGTVDSQNGIYCIPNQNITAPIRQYILPVFFNKAAYPCESKDVTTTDIIPTSTISTLKVNRMTLFSRALSISEYKYLYNNGIGSDFQSLSNVVFDIRNNYSEVIGDTPCIRDYSGNGFHGIINNLPAGTAQQKVDYANANLFVPFQ